MSKIIRLNEQLREAVICTLVNLAKLFTPAIKLTLVARHQSDEAAFVIFSEDKLEKVIETLQRHLKEERAAEALRLPPRKPTDAV